MSDQKSILKLDSLSGGNGDVWMRLIGLYSMAALRKEIAIQILIPKFIRGLAKFAFGDRIEILESIPAGSAVLTFSSKGARDLVGGVLHGKRYILPYQRATIQDKKKRELKDYLNMIIFNIANFLEFVHLPPWANINNYQAFLDISAIKQFRSVKYEEFVCQLKIDSNKIFDKLQGRIPLSPELIIPQSLENEVLVFPTGTSRQFVPIWWASKNLSEARYAFFAKDNERLAYEAAGLKTLQFYSQPGDIIALAKRARWTISTDSFPSHLLQYSVKNCTITITEVLKSRIISPGYTGSIADAEAPCHPCLHLDRTNNPFCEAGHKDCINWSSAHYTQSILQSIRQ